MTVKSNIFEMTLISVRHLLVTQRIGQCCTAYRPLYYTMLGGLFACANLMTQHSIYYKAAFLLLLAQLTVACSNPSGRAPDLNSQVTPTAPSVVNPTSKATVQKLNYTFGPFRLPAGMAAKSMTGKNAPFNFRVEAPVWVTGFEPRLTNANGDVLKGNYVQLLVLSNGREVNTACTQRQTANPFAAATANLQKMTLPDGHGYPILPEDPLEAKIVLRNPTEEDLNDIYVTFTLTAEPMDVAQHKKDVIPMMLAVEDPCDFGLMALPPQGLVEKNKSFVISESGKVVKVQGLLQNYGVSYSISTEADIDSEKFTWSTLSKQNVQHEIVELQDYDNANGVMIEKGKAINLSVVYDNFSTAWINDATGAAIVYLEREAPTIPRISQPSTNSDSKQPSISISAAQKLLF